MTIDERSKVDKRQCKEMERTVRMGEFGGFWKAYQTPWIWQDEARRGRVAESQTAPFLETRLD